MKKLLLIFIVNLFFTACSGVTYYYKNSYTHLLKSDADFLEPPPDEPEYTLVDDMMKWEKRMLKEGYVMLGYSQHFSPQAAALAKWNSTGWGEKIGAARVLQIQPIESGNNLRYFLASYWAKVKFFIFGAYYDDIPKNVSEKVGFNKGVLVKSIANNSPAAKADIRQGDLILFLDEKLIDDTEEMDTLITEYAGKKVNLRIWSLDNGETIEVPVQLNMVKN